MQRESRLSRPWITLQRDPKPRRGAWTGQEQELVEELEDPRGLAVAAPGL